MKNTPAGPAKDLIGLPVLALAAANLLPLAGIFLFGWDRAGLLFFYWSENLVIGFYTLLRILLARGGKADLADRLKVSAFFCFHFGGFCLAHGMALVSLLRPESLHMHWTMRAWPEQLRILQLLWAMMLWVWKSLPQGLMVPLLGLAASHGASFWIDYVRGKEYLKAVPEKMMMRPYTRIFIMHVSVIVGALASAKLSLAAPILVSLVAFKSGLDIYFHRRLVKAGAGHS